MADRESQSMLQQVKSFVLSSGEIPMTVLLDTLHTQVKLWSLPTEGLLSSMNSLSTSGGESRGALPWNPATPQNVETEGIVLGQLLHSVWVEGQLGPHLKVSLVL